MVKPYASPTMPNQVEKATNENSGSIDGFSVEVSMDGTVETDFSATSSVTTVNEQPTGELGLLQSLERSEEVGINRLPSRVVKTLQRSLSEVLDIPQQPDSVYRQPLPVKEALLRMKPDNKNSKGLGWYATIVPDEFMIDGQLRSGLNPKDFDVAAKTIKPRRASLPVQNSDFFGSLTKIKSSGGSCRYIFYGLLNGWPGLRCLEVERVDVLRQVRVDLLGKWSPIWSNENQGNRGVELRLADPRKVHRAKLRAPAWSAKGWSPESPGYAFWYEPQRDTPIFSYGMNMTTTVTNDKCKAIHMISHRYAKERESPRDRLTYHSVAFLEWECGEYGTLIEYAYLNGMGGYRGMCNWYDDRDQSVTELYRSMSPELISPWRETSGEIRCFDIPSKNLDDFKAYIAKYEGPSKRFLDPRYSSFPARLTFRMKSHIAQYLVNYISRDSTYATLTRNCQTFCADLCSFIAGKREVTPFHPVNRVEYSNQAHLFLYDSYLYDRNKDETKKKGLLASIR